MPEVKNERAELLVSVCNPRSISDSWWETGLKKGKGDGYSGDGQQDL